MFLKREKKFFFELLKITKKTKKKKKDLIEEDDQDDQDYKEKAARDKIEHVVVLMLENRSFFHALGG